MNLVNILSFARDVDDLRELLAGLVALTVGTLSAAEAATA